MSCVLTHEKNARKPLLGRPDEAAAAPLLPNNVPLDIIRLNLVLTYGIPSEFRHITTYDCVLLYRAILLCSSLYLLITVLLLFSSNFWCKYSSVGPYIVHRNRKRLLLSQSTLREEESLRKSTRCLM